MWTGPAKRSGQDVQFALNLPNAKSCPMEGEHDILQFAGVIPAPRRPTGFVRAFFAGIGAGTHHRNDRKTARHPPLLLPLHLPWLEPLALAVMRVAHGPVRRFDDDKTSASFIRFSDALAEPDRVIPAGDYGV